jgi:hypothetical protein
MTLTDSEDRIVRRGIRTCHLVEGRPSFFMGKTLSDFVVLMVKVLEEYIKFLLGGRSGMIVDETLREIVSNDLPLCGIWFARDGVG